MTTVNSSWIEKLKAAKKTAILQDGIRLFDLPERNCVHCSARKWKRKTPLGGDGPWEFEVGESPSLFAGMEEISEANTNPRFGRSDTSKAFQWRVRNMPYPLNVYSVQVDSGDNTLVLKTSNKKYYKKFDIPDMKRLNLPLSQDAITLNHANNTLLISVSPLVYGNHNWCDLFLQYTKPDEFLQYEKQLKLHLSTVKSIDEKESECKTS
ncbi:protein DPCD [Paragonimus westermani]|uniref:Protein DPCD n=1 Tax=Paragonimus westermani TaxID=34504 RepID=A0A5J4NKG3_9TREM|nr:protein DPCD [Paragonimus westermani]